MFRFDVRRAVGVLAVAIALAMADPVAAAGRNDSTLDRNHSTAAVRTSGVWSTALLVVRQAAAASPFGRLVAAWMEEGHLIDPNGLIAIPLPDPNGGTGGTTSTGSTDEGHLIDPNG